MAGRSAMLALVLALAGAGSALRADAGELVRYRLPDGSVGLTDDASKLPPGALVESRRKPTSSPSASPATAAEPVAPPAAPAEATPPPVTPPEATPAGEGRVVAAPLDVTSFGSDRAPRCRRYDLPPTCSARELELADGWAHRGWRARDDLTRAEGALAAEEDRYEWCKSHTVRPICPDEDVERAKEKVAVAERALDTLEEHCRHEGCLPGWLREKTGPGWD